MLQLKESTADFVWHQMFSPTELTLRRDELWEQLFLLIQEKVCSNDALCFDEESFC